jgi:putative DNA primase/helicase
VLVFRPEGIPSKLRGLPCWVLEKREIREGRETKVPYLAPGMRAKSNMPSTWMTWETALRQLERHKKIFDSLGLMRGDESAFVDWDGAVGEGECLVEWDFGLDDDTASRAHLASRLAQPASLVELIEPFAYIESSVSGTGLHGYCFASIPPDGIQVKVPGGTHAGFELYTRTSRCFWATGHERSLGDKFGEDASAALREMHARISDLKLAMQAKVRGPFASAPGYIPAPLFGEHATDALLASASDDDPARRDFAALTEATDEAASAETPLASAPRPQIVPELPLTDDELWKLSDKPSHWRLRAILEGRDGDIPRVDMTPSGFDFAAAQCFAWYLGPDSGRIDDWMHRIPGFRTEKWHSPRNGSTYGADTVRNAIAATRGQFQRPKGRGRPQSPPSSGQTPKPEKPPKPESAPARDGFDWTDVGNAERFRLRFGEQIRYAAELKTWLQAADPHWRPDTSRRVEQLAVFQVEAMTREGREVSDAAFTKFSLMSQSNGRIEAMLNLAKSLPGIAISVEDLDRDPWLLNNLSGTYELKAGVLRDHRREDYITHMVPCEYKPAARHPAWDRFLEAAIPDPETREFLQKAAGYTLTGSTREEVAFLLVGEGRNGKGTFLHVLQTLLGDLATTSNFETFLITRRDLSAELASFRGKRMVVAQEAGTRATFNEAVLKNLTGGDRIKARGLYQNPFEYLPQFKLWLAMNDLPDVRDASPGFWQRIRVIPFRVSFAGSEDKNLKTELTQPEVLEAVLAWAVEGCRRWLEEGLGSAPAVATATVEYREESDSVSLWVEERCEEHPQLELQASVAYLNYSDFCKTQNIWPVGTKIFRRVLEAKGYGTKKNNVRYFIGLALKNLAR